MRAIQADSSTLEPQTAVHAAALFDVLCDPALYVHEGARPTSIEWLTERLARLESRRSPDGAQQWLNWVIRIPTNELVGYVQATVHADGRADIAYVLSSAHWGRGIASRAVAAMIAELAERHGVTRLLAILKRENLRSLRLLERLRFEVSSPECTATLGLEDGEVSMCRAATIG
jgi:RimJ/RimL family protein N-acetyltransferase